MGRDDNQQTPISGAAGALQVWTELMKNLPTRSLESEPPPGVSFDWVDKMTGKLSAEGCEGAVWLPLRDDFRPLESADCKMVEKNPLKSLWQKILN